MESRKGAKKISSYFDNEGRRIGGRGETRREEEEGKEGRRGNGDGVLR